MINNKFINELYNEDGTFNPLTNSKGNIDENISHLRNTYMTAEREYFEALLSIETLREEFERYLNYDVDYLIKAAKKLQELIETGNLTTKKEIEKLQLMTPEKKEKYYFEKLERAEGMLTLLFAAIQDKDKIKELILEYHPKKSK